MKLAFCIYKYFPFGGLQQDMMAMAHEAVGKGHHVDIYTLEWRGDKPSDISVACLSKKGLSNHQIYLNFAKELNHLFSQESYDVVVGFNKIPGIDVYYAGDPCYKAKALEHKNMLRRCTRRHKILSYFEEAVLGETSDCKILVISQKQQEEFSQHYHTSLERFSLLPPYIVQNRFSSAKNENTLHKELNLSEDILLITTIGSGFKMKGVDRALQAIASLPSTLQEKVHYFVAGDDNPDFFIKMAKELGLESRVTFSRGRQDVPSILKESTLLLHPAYSEAGGKILLEALVSGLPVLTTEVCGYAFHVKNAQAGFVLTSPFSQDTLNKALQEMLVTQSKTLRDNAIAYSEQVNFSQMPAIAVEEILKKARPRPVTWPRNMPAKWLSQTQLAQIMALKGNTVREVEKRKTLRFEKETQGYYAKLHFGVGVREILKNIIQGRWPVVSAQHEYRAINRLKRLNIPTLNWVAYGNKGLNPASKQSFILTDEIKNTINLEDFSKTWKKNPPSFSLRLALIKELARISRILHRNGLNHRDYYACHFLMEQSKEKNILTGQDLKMYLIDLHRMTVKKHLRERWVVKDLGSLYFSLMESHLNSRDLLRFIKFYFEKPLKHSFESHRYFWNKVSSRALKLRKKAIKKGYCTV